MHYNTHARTHACTHACTHAHTHTEIGLMTIGKICKADLPKECAAYKEIATQFCSHFSGGKCHLETLNKTLNIFDTIQPIFNKMNKLCIAI